MPLRGLPYKDPSMSRRLLFYPLIDVMLILIFTAGVALATTPENPGGENPFDADVVPIHKLFYDRKFPELTAFLQKYLMLCDQDIRWEVAVQSGFSVFGVPDPSFTQELDKWVKSSPKDWVPRLSRALHYISLAQMARGTAWAKDTSPEQFRRMRELLSEAAIDVDAALDLNPRLLIAYCLRIRIGNMSPELNEDGLLAKKALKIFPESYLIRFEVMRTLTPRWGGSYEEMERFARESAPYIGKNPMIKSLPGFVYWDMADLAYHKGDTGTAITLYEHALSYGENWTFLRSLAEAYFDAGMDDKALRTIESAITLRPNEADGRIIRSKVLFRQRRWEEALTELNEADRRGGISSGGVAEVRKWDSNMIVRSGISLLDVNPTDAIDKHTLALKFFPGNIEAYLERGRAHARAGRPESAIADLQKAVDMGTRRYIAYKNLSDLLVSQNRLDESIMCWTRLIEREPGNPNAWMERAEVNYKKDDTAATLRDANRACELGNKSGCRRAESLKEKRPDMKPRLLL